MTTFETETMAELYLKQGQTEEALTIFRRLVGLAVDEVTRARRLRRLTELERALGRAPAPGVTGAADDEAEASGEPALRARRIGENLVLEWTLPAATAAPALQLLLLRRTPGGIETEAQTLRLDAVTGRAAVAAAGLHSLRAAAGRMDGDRFVPLVRLDPATR
jgi:hypothetical protein